MIPIYLSLKRRVTAEHGKLLLGVRPDWPGRSVVNLSLFHESFCRQGAGVYL